MHLVEDFSEGIDWSSPSNTGGEHANDERRQHSNARTRQGRTAGAPRDKVMSVVEWGGDWSVPDEVIPACGVRRTGSYDPRPPQMTLHRTYGQRMSLRNDFEAHEIVIHAFDHTVTISELKYAAAEFRKLDPQLERIVIFISPENYRENFNALCHLKFERTMAREDAANRDFCVVKQCKVKL